MSSDLKVRVADSERDWLGAAAVEAEMLPDAYPRFFFKQALSLFGPGFHVCEMAGAIVGYALTQRHADEPNVAELYSVIVAKSQQGRGVGRTLVQASIEFARASTCSAVKLTVSPTNTNAIGLYESAGFEKIELIPEYYGGGEDRFVMKRSMER